MENITTVALSRLIAQQRAMDVTASNIANATTPGYRAERVQFSDWLLRQAGGGLAPGERAISYTQDRATWRDERPGPVSHTGNPLDLALGETNAYFTVQTGRGPRLTRAGRFQLAADGGIVDANGDALLDTAGRKLQLSSADTIIHIAGDGTLSSENGEIGRVGIVAADNVANLRAEGDRDFSTSGPTRPVAAPRLVQGAVQESNVQPITEMTRMTSDLRTFQFVTQLLQAEADREQNAIDKLLPKQS
jgi:flagellar basal-body rod protein FlgF